MISASNTPKPGVGIHSRKTYVKPYLQKIGLVKNLTLKSGSVSDGLAPRTP
jgi:hypothetical protein